MSAVSTNSTAASPTLIATVIVSVLAVCAFFGWGAWRVCQSADRAERDPRYRRRLLLRGALVYALCAAYGIEEVISGNAPVQSLFGLIVPAFLIWLYIKQANRVKLPPA
jgi:threonine/homoserine/homoserine lactone efflux protein